MPRHYSPCCQVAADPVDSGRLLPTRKLRESTISRTTRSSIGQAGTGPHRRRIAEKMEFALRTIASCQSNLEGERPLVGEPAHVHDWDSPNCAPAVYPHLSVSNGDIWTNISVALSQPLVSDAPMAPREAPVLRALQGQSECLRVSDRFCPLPQHSCEKCSVVSLFRMLDSI